MHKAVFFQSFVRSQKLQVVQNQSYYITLTISLKWHEIFLLFCLVSIHKLFRHKNEKLNNFSIFALKLFIVFWGN